jgi:hypothetical protein
LLGYRSLRTENQRLLLEVAHQEESLNRVFKSTPTVAASSASQQTVMGGASSSPKAPKSLPPAHPSSNTTVPGEHGRLLFCFVKLLLMKLFLKNKN